MDYMERALKLAQKADGLGSRYQGQNQPTPSRYYQEFQAEKERRP